MPKSSKSNKNFEFEPAPDIHARIQSLAMRCQLTWVDEKRIFCIRSQGSKTRASARIWGLPRVWQEALGTPPAYIIEVIKERFDKLPPDSRDRVLLHELAHIPKNFSGALVAHKRRGGVNSEVIDKLFASLSKP